MLTHPVQNMIEKLYSFLVFQEGAALSQWIAAHGQWVEGLESHQGHQWSQERDQTTIAAVRQR